MVDFCIGTTKPPHGLKETAEELLFVVAIENGYMFINSAFMKRYSIAFTDVQKNAPMDRLFHVIKDKPADWEVRDKTKPKPEELAREVPWKV